MIREDFLIYCDVVWLLISAWYTGTPTISYLCLSMIREDFLINCDFVGLLILAWYTRTRDEDPEFFSTDPEFFSTDPDPTPDPI